MDLIDLYELKKKLTQDEILMCFAGPFSHSIIEELGIAVRRYLEAEQATQTSLMSVFSIFIELSQNIKNYTERKTSEWSKNGLLNCGIIIIGKRGNRFLVCSGNYVDRTDIAAPTEKLEMIGTLDRKGLKEEYRKQLRRERAPGESAGLGLLEMARNASEPLQYSVKQINDNQCFLTLNAFV